MEYVYKLVIQKWKIHYLLTLLKQPAALRADCEYLTFSVTVTTCTHIRTTTHTCTYIHTYVRIHMYE